MQTQISGDKLKEIGTYERVKLILIDFLRGYPAWRYFGIFEYYFGEELGKKIINKLKDDEFIDVKEEEKTYYWLTPKGVQLASSLSTRQRVKNFRDIGLVLVGMTLVVGLAHYLLSYAQFPLF